LVFFSSGLGKGIVGLLIVAVQRYKEKRYC
jgi:hypothetical protein